MTRAELLQQNDNVIYENTNREITGQILHDHLQDIINSVTFPENDENTNIYNSDGIIDELRTVRLTQGYLIIKDEKQTGDTTGIQYDGDYSAGFTNRSLVDKEYVDNAVVNGNVNIYNSDGTINEDRIVTLISGKTLTIEGNAGLGNSGVSSEIFFDGISAYFSQGINGSNNGNLAQVTLFADDTENYIYFQISGGTNTCNIKLDSSSLKYDDDYSLNYTNRSLVDKEYVDTQITNNTVTASNGLTKTGNIIKLGGTVNEDTVVQLSNDKYLSIGSYSGRFLFTENNGAKFIDERQGGNTGLEYDGDYSADFVDRSLVDKGYVDTQISNSIVTANNGLNKTLSNVIELGGTLNKVTTLNLGGYNFNVEDTDTSASVITLKKGLLAGQYSEIEITNDTVKLEISQGTSGIQTISIDKTNGIKITDSVNNKGVEYDNDYSTNYTDRSLIDKGYHENYNHNKKTHTHITSDTTLDIVNSNEVTMGNTSGGDVTITLPIHTDIPNDGKIYTFYFTKITTDSNKVVIQLTSPDTFPLGITKFELLYAGESVRIGGTYDDGWFRIGQMKIAEKVTRTTAWDASNFSTASPIPFENEIVNDNDEVFSWDSADPTKIICNVKTRANIAYNVDIDSTGGTTWTAITQVYKNGVAIVGSKSRTGNYGNEDQNMSRASIIVDVEVGDYIELYVEQNNLTGNVEYADFQIDSLL